MKICNKNMEKRIIFLNVIYRKEKFVNMNYNFYDGKCQSKQQKKLSCNILIRILNNDLPKFM